MQVVTVGQPNSQYHGLKTRCCNRRTRTGQVLLFALTAARQGVSWRERAFALHTVCLAKQLATAPEGAPVAQSDVDAEFAALRAAATAA